MPLSETPSIVKDKIRTPGEAMIDIASLIQRVSVPSREKDEIERLIKNTWLDGVFSHQHFDHVTAIIKRKMRNNPAIIERINKIASSLESKFFITKRNDNYYGRLFETELSKYIIEMPSFNMMKVRNTIASFIIDDFLKMSYDKQKELCECIAHMMFMDTPSWRYDLCQANEFMASEEPHKFIEMMRFTGEYSIPLILSVAVKYINKATGMSTIADEAGKYYINDINRQRNLIASISSDEQLVTKTHGLLLPYQKNISIDYEAIPGIGIRPIDKYQRPIRKADITEHDELALWSERAIGIGMSGSANLLHFLFRKIQSENENFSMNDAKLATAAWLTHSGGHSFNEAYSSFEFMKSGSFKPLSFNKLSQSSDLGRNAVSHSYNKVLEASRRLKN